MNMKPSAAWHAYIAWLFVAPALFVLTVFFFLPTLATLLLSVTDYDLYALGNLENLRFIALKNYVSLFEEPRFWQALGNTFYFVATAVPLSIAMSLGMAVLINSKFTRFKGFFRTALFAPVVTTLVAMAVTWRYIFHTQYGLMNAFLSLFGISPIDWLGDPHWAMPALVLLAVWKNFGYNMIIFIAALQTIPPELCEAARIDGANAWQQFRCITLPLLKPTLALVSIITIAGYSQLFAEPYMMTEGGPLQSTVSVLYYMYDEGFKWWNLGRAAAIALILFFIMFALTLLQWRMAKRHA